ncbi:MAG TPA: hypothetical protein VG248_13000 [Caulobacteraceae bacterium]|nr:hypothetical protein [Caulobacteraceae bacterium]
MSAALNQSAAEAARAFAAALPVAPTQRVEAKISGPHGMVLLRAIEAALCESLPGSATHELVWASGDAGAGLLRLRAFGATGEVLAQAEHLLAA